jgi:cell division protein FtsL
MIRILHTLAILALIASAVYAYTIKYDTLKHVEQLARLKSNIQREQDTIAVYKAEWQRLNSPERIQALADKHLSLQPLLPLQIVKIDELPMRRERTDEIGRKLELLGVLAPTDTPKPKQIDTARTTPGSTRTTAAATSGNRITANKNKPAAVTPEYTGSIRPLPATQNNAPIAATTPAKTPSAHAVERQLLPPAPVYDHAAR